MKIQSITLSITFLAILLALFAGAPVAFAFEEGNMWEHVSQRFDTDGDGQITAEELGSERRFAHMDRNEDGVVTEEDLEGFEGFRRGYRGHRGHGPRPGGLLVRAADADRSRDVSAAEWTSLMTTLDPDGDGTIEPGAFQALRPGREGMAPPAEASERITSFLDRNDNGVLEVDDLNTLYADLDTNDDGALSREELPMGRRGFHRGGHRGMGKAHGGPGMGRPRMIGMADTNDDGEVSASEWQEAFGKLDVNGDGVLSPEDRSAAGFDH